MPSGNTVNITVTHAVFIALYSHDNTFYTHVNNGVTGWHIEKHWCFTSIEYLCWLIIIFFQKLNSMFLKRQKLFVKV